ncbi:MAG: pyridoxal-phosphate dependent enzyme [Albidovulum sp.]|nr:pyridoxal-phosphate dependent enzyme [Albidovulum sp.]
MLRSLECLDCRQVMPLAEHYNCPECAGELKLSYEYAAIRRRGEFARNWRSSESIFSRFGELLPHASASSAITLGEGNTPLIRAGNLENRLSPRELYLKLECCNPTGSFKDRQVSVGITVARSFGRRRFAVTSSGNVGNSLAAYAARSGTSAYVWVSQNTPAAKRRQIDVYGSRVFEIESGHRRDDEDAFDNSYEIAVRALPSFCRRNRLVPMTSARPVNPFMVEGAKTIAYEICADLGCCPDVVAAPVGGGGLVGGLSEGFRDLREIGLTDRVPRIVAGQPLDYFAGIDKVDDPDCKGARPLDANWAVESIRNSGGNLHRLARSEILAAQAELAATEGIFAEPRGAYALAALAAEAGTGRIGNGTVAVVIVSGTGLKDMAAAAEFATRHNLVSSSKVSSIWDSKLDPELETRKSHHSEGG